MHHKGVAAYDTNRFTEAISFFSAALEIVKTASFHFARGSSYLVTSDFKRALQDYEVALLHYKSSENRQGEGTVYATWGLRTIPLASMTKPSTTIPRRWQLPVISVIGGLRGPI